MSSAFSRISSGVGNAMTNIFGSPNGSLSGQRVIVSPLAENPDYPAMYRALKAYYFNNRLYDELATVLNERGIKHEAIKGIRNPTHTVVEFYASTLWPGPLKQALPLDIPDTNPKRDNLEAAIMQVWQWSNWATNKQVSARGLTNLGDHFIQVATRSDSDGQIVSDYFNLLNPENVTDFDVDERGFITWIRLDVPMMRRKEPGDEVERYVQVEVWDKSDGSYRIWEVKKEMAHRDISKLGEPLNTENIVEKVGDDFIPIVHIKCIDVGEKRGVAIITPALDKIDEWNRNATRLHQMLFRHGKPDMQVVSIGNDNEGRPIPPSRPRNMDDSEIHLGDETLYYMQSGEIKTIVPNLPYQAHLDAIQAVADDLRTTDLPELEYGRIQESSELSGRAIRLKMTAAVSRVIEVRGNAEAGLIRATQMALTMAQKAGLAGFSEAEIGTWDAGDFDFTIAEREVIPLDDFDRAQIDYQKAQTALILQAIRDSEALLRLAGVPDDEIVTLQAEDPGTSETLDDGDPAPRLNRGFVR